ncbi:MAG: glycosyl hydrolase [Pseudomonadota bacterium]|nr:glycosyl hydrolase [Pseudomonadota bacterium]
MRVWNFFRLSTLGALLSMSFFAHAANDTIVSKQPKDRYAGMLWREVGPFRGGRAAAITGVATDPSLYYMGATGGGVWKTSDTGLNWKNISDGSFGGSIGAIAVAPSDANVIYVGTGEGTLRGNLSQGEGVWRSVDAGRSWQFAGLPNSRTIPRIVVDPRDPNVALAAVLGDVFAPSDERGVYRTNDGGASWRRVLFAGQQAGAYHVVLDPSNPRIAYATTWRVQRGPNFLSSGGEGSGLWKSNDAGEHWLPLSGNDGLPQATPEKPIGISTIAISASQPDNLYAMIEAEEGGLFRSRDAGKTWTLVNSDRALRQRAWYFSGLSADPMDPESVWVLNVRLHRSRDGGKSFTVIATPHGDHHDQWIDPGNPQRIASANDGGGCISNDGGITWSTQSNQPTAQIYRVATDNAFPYRLLGAQQDNSALRIRSRSLRSGSIDNDDWESTAGGESGWITAKPDAPDIVFGGSYMGFLVRLDHTTDAARGVNVWPEETMGHAANDVKYRFQWNFPLLYSRHLSNRLFAAGNRLFSSDNDGQTWTAISPDLTRADPTTLGASGGPITQDNTSIEYYGTIFSLAESALDAKVIWTGSDDGLIHVTRNGGTSWTEVTPRGAPKDMQWNTLEASPFDAAGAYAVGTRYKTGDRRPYLYRTADAGKSWRAIVARIDAQHFARTLRADPARRGVLYAGTERGLYLSENNGDSWRAFQLNLPQVPITDLQVRDGDLIAATQGRGFWILDDLTPIVQTDAGQQPDTSALKLYRPRKSYRLDASADEKPIGSGTNPPPGSMLYFRLPRAATAADELTLSFSTLDNKPVIAYTRKPKAAEIKDEKPSKKQDLRKLPAEEGINRFAWDGRYPAPGGFEGMVLWGGEALAGPRVVPGRYRATLNFNGESQSAEWEILPDPRSNTSSAQYRAQLLAAREVSDKLTEVHQRVGKLTELGTALSALATRIKDQPALKSAADALEAQRAAAIEVLYQTKLKSEQDPLNYPVRLNNKLSTLLFYITYGDNPPTDAQLALKTDLFTRSATALAAADQVLGSGIENLNRKLAKAGVLVLVP